MRKVAFVLLTGLLIPAVSLDAWAEPYCDPTANPMTCNISAPINVSGSAQSKSGSLTIGSGGIGTLAADGIFDANGAANFDGSFTVNGVADFSNTVSFSNPVTFSNIITATCTLTINPATGRAIAIQPNTTSDGIWISGATGSTCVP